MLTLVNCGPVKFETTKQCPKCLGSGEVRSVDHKALRLVRFKCGVSLRTMAKRIGVTPPYLSDIELGRRGCPDYVVKEYNKLTH